MKTYRIHYDMKDNGKWINLVGSCYIEAENVREARKKMKEWLSSAFMSSADVRINRGMDIVEE